MNGTRQYLKLAEAALAEVENVRAASQDLHLRTADHYVAKAQVYATLALAAATWERP